MRKNCLENYGAKNAGTQKIEGGGLKNVDVFDEEPGSRRAASILGCLDLGGDYTTRPWAGKGKGSALAKLALDRPAGS